MEVSVQFHRHGAWDSAALSDDSIQPITARCRTCPRRSPSHGCYHFPVYDMAYFEALTSEVKIVKPNRDIEYEQSVARK